MSSAGEPADGTPREGSGPPLAGRYRLREALGSGGMATVYLADDLKHGREVAVKILRPEVGAVLGPDRFRREIEVAARLNHPHILALYDSGEDGGLLYFAMPRVEGGSLRDRIEREGRLPVDEALGLARQVASALSHAHARGVVHRDLKPENILLHAGEAMVADFGIALAVGAVESERLTRTGLALGTPEYMSPEQAAGDPGVDARSDQYGLACLLYEMLAGEPPHAGPTARAVITRRLVEPASSIRHFREAVPMGVERALARALAVAPEDRFPSVAAFAGALSAPALSAELSAQTAPRSVAVLPFVNVSPDPENEYFADGITEDVIAQLSKVRGLRVISRTSVMMFKKRGQSLREIGARLNAGALLDGSVRRVGDRVRIVAQLVDAETDRHLWAETYDRRLTDIFEIQADVALQIAAALETWLSPDERSRIQREPTSDLEAYQLYLQGRHCFIRYTPDSMRRSISFYERALERDPEYALALVGLAQARIELAEQGSTEPEEEPYALASEALERALELDGELAEAHSGLAIIKFVHDFDWAGAERAFRRALELNPSAADAWDSYGRLLGAVERYDEAVAAQRHARELDPLAHPLDLATALLRAGRYDEALEVANQSLELNPRSPRGHATAGWAHLKAGEEERGLAELEEAIALAPGVGVWLAQLGEAYGLVGRTDDARKVLAELEELSGRTYVSPYHMAYVYTGLGDHDAAIDYLERAYEARSGAVYGIKGSFLFEPLRGHAGFTALLEKIGLA